MIERSIATGTHGRYLIAAPENSRPPLLIGFHGYAESADHEFQRLNSIPGAERWLRLSIQGLHRFYRGRGTEVVASWMTRQDRDHAIHDNAAYVHSVIENVVAECSASPARVFGGFSQGVAMAYRAATSSSIPPRAVIALGGDVPPELDAASLRRIPCVLIGRGVRDEWYTAEKHAADERRLAAAGVVVQSCVFDGGHEWTAEFAAAAGRLLKDCIS